MSMSMMMQSKQLSLAPPPGATSFVQGWPGIFPERGGDDGGTGSRDGDRAGPGGRTQPRVEGRILVRFGQDGRKDGKDKGKCKEAGLYGAWVRVELRKLEVLPDGQAFGELLGNGPMTVWHPNLHKSIQPQTRPCNRLPGPPHGRSAGSSVRAAAGSHDGCDASDDCPDGQAWARLTNHEFHFELPLDPNLPPSARIDKTSELAYEIVASVCVRVRKRRRGMTLLGSLRNRHQNRDRNHGLYHDRDPGGDQSDGDPDSATHRYPSDFDGNWRTIVLQTTMPIPLLKYELHPSWPIYRHPARHELVALVPLSPAGARGRLSSRKGLGAQGKGADGLSGGGAEGAMCNVKASLLWDQHCFGPGDKVSARLVLESFPLSGSQRFQLEGKEDQEGPHRHGKAARHSLRVKNIVFSLKETVTFLLGSSSPSIHSITPASSTIFASASPTAAAAHASSSASRTSFSIRPSSSGSGSSTPGPTPPRPPPASSAPAFRPSAATQRIATVVSRTFSPGPDSQLPYNPNLNTDADSPTGKELTSVMYDVDMTIPPNHTLMSINTARHIVVDYT